MAVNEVLTAQNAALAAEYAAIYGYQVIAARIPQRRARAEQALKFHIKQRDALRQAILRSGGTPSEALAAYQVPPVTKIGQAERLAQTLEEACLAPFAALIAVLPGSDRAAAAEALSATAQRFVAWGGTPTAFPGLTQ